MVPPPLPAGVLLQSVRHPSHLKFLGLIDHPFPIVVVRGVLPQCLLHVLWVYRCSVLYQWALRLSLHQRSMHISSQASSCVPLWIALQMQTQDVWLVLAVRTALTLSAAQFEEVRSRLFVCVGSRRVLRGFTLSAVLAVALSIAPGPIVLSMGTQTGWDGNPVSIGPVTFSHALHVATFNARRLWLCDESIHDGYPMLSQIFLSEDVGVC